MARRIAAPAAPWTPRQAILRAVIEEYVITATPGRQPGAGRAVSPRRSQATVRDVLAELEAAGLLAHPHTCAGRIPTERGYRFYVESIVDSTPLPAVEQLMIRHQFGQVEFASEHWFRLAATTLASLTGAAGLATAAKPARRASAGSTSSPSTIGSPASILVLREGTIKQALRPRRRVDQADADPRREPSQRRARRPDRERHRACAVFFAEAARPGVDADWPPPVAVSSGGSASGSPARCASPTPPRSRRSTATASST